MKLIYFKLDSNYVVWKRYDGKVDRLYEEIYLPESQIKGLSHEHTDRGDEYRVNNYLVTKETFESVLTQIKGE